MTALQALSTSPDSQSARIGVVNAAQSLAQQLNATTHGIQSLRANAEPGLNECGQHRQQRDGADRGHQQAAAARAGRPTRPTAALLDQRDQYIEQLSELMDVRVVTNGQNQVTVFTKSGVQLVGRRGGDSCRSMRRAR